MATDSPKECTLTLEDGTHYDLSSLSSTKADYEAPGIAGGSGYKLNVCRSVVGELWMDDPEDVGGYINREKGDFSLGRVNSTLRVSPTGDPMIYMQNGSACPTNPDEHASTSIRFICSPTDFHAGIPKLITSFPPDDNAQGCHFYFEWSTHVACPTSRKAELESSHYFAFGAILLIVFLTWFGGHTLYNRLHLGRRGMDQFPVSIPKPKISLPTPFKKSSSTAPAGRSFFRRSQRSGYSNVRAEEYDGEDEGFAGRFSLEDDDEDAEDLTGQGLGGERDAWRGAPSAREDQQQGKVGVHQGLVDV